ncbi:hypothetical protein MLD38_001668 [Melastoma candidum]|uniref:Uncharacterized protein n=1 Tax=Melastoma candidum TaxID=119954 RepID=A0ACB9SE22_9MYRT|nr:hypothetical protein MLD38_001668 [Melastoma candidum]
MTGPRDDPGREAPRSKLTNSTSTDLLVCFPSRTRLPLIPKRVCNPTPPLTADPLRRRQVGLGRSYSAVGLGRASPLVRGKGDGHASVIAEPTSPRVTCSGQIRVRRSLRSGAGEIERFRDGGKKPSRKKSTGCKADGQGSKKDGVQQPPACSRRPWLDLRCFGCSFPESRIAADSRGGEEQQSGKADAMGTMFAKWFMVLQQDNRDDNTIGVVRGKDIISVVDAPPGDPPPGNALLLMRCRSTPTRAWSDRTESSRNDYQGENDGETEQEEEEEDQGDPTKQKINDSLVTTKFDSDPFSGVPQKEHRMVNRPVERIH